MDREPVEPPPEQQRRDVIEWAQHAREHGSFDALHQRLLDEVLRLRGRTSRNHPERSHDDRPAPVAVPSNGWWIFDTVLRDVDGVPTLYRRWDYDWQATGAPSVSDDDVNEWIDEGLVEAVTFAAGRPTPAAEAAAQQPFEAVTAAASDLLHLLLRLGQPDVVVDEDLDEVERNRREGLIVVGRSVLSASRQGRHNEAIADITVETERLCRRYNLDAH